MSSIERATATYTGGGIYIYTGQLDNGDYFMSNDSFVEYVEFFNADPYAEFEESCSEEWQSRHHIGDYSGTDAERFYKEVLKWIIANKPEGNYQVYELETRLSKQ